MESLGSFLKRGRLEAGITLEELAERTRIRPDALESLETGDLEGLPSDTYVRGFVKLVCRELGLPARDGLVRYEALREQVGPLDEITWAEERSEEAPGRLHRALEDPERVVRRARLAARAAVVAGGALAAVLLAWGGAVIVERSARPAEDGASPPPNAPQPDGAAPRPADAGEPGTSSAAAARPPDETKAEPAPPKPVPRTELLLPLEQVQLTIDPPRRVVPGQILVTVQPAASPEDGAKAGTVQLVQGEASSSEETSRTAPPDEDARGAQSAGPPRTRSPGGLPETTRADVMPSLPDPTTARTAPRPVAGARVVLEVIAVREVEVHVLLDGIGYPRVARMSAGERRSWKADSLFTVSSSDGGAIRLRLAGEDLGRPGRDFEVLDRLVIRGDR